MINKTKTTIRIGKNQINVTSQKKKQRANRRLQRPKCFMKWLCWLNNYMRLQSTLLNILFTLVFCPLLSTILRCPRPRCLKDCSRPSLGWLFLCYLSNMLVPNACNSGCECESTYFCIRWPGVTSEKLSTIVDVLVCNMCLMSIPA